MVLLISNSSNAYISEPPEKSFLQKAKERVGLEVDTQTDKSFNSIDTVILVVRSRLYDKTPFHFEAINYLNSDEFKAYSTKEFMAGRFNIRTFYILDEKELYEEKYYSIASNNSTLLINMEYTIQQTKDDVRQLWGVSYYRNGKFNTPHLALKTNYNSAEIKEPNTAIIKKNINSFIKNISRNFNDTFYGGGYDSDR